MSRRGCAAARLTLLQKQHRREAVDAPPPAAKRKTSTALGRPAPGKGPVRQAVPLELGPAVVCLGQQQDHRAHLGGPQAGWVRPGLFLSGQKRSPPRPVQDEPEEAPLPTHGGAPETCPARGQTEWTGQRWAASTLLSAHPWRNPTQGRVRPLGPRGGGPIARKP